MKLFSPDAAHWYQRDGQPMHSVLSLKGEPRPTTLRDARKLNLLPSVTNILGVIAKPELTAWLQEQAVMAALTLPRLDGETEDVFARRVVEDSLTTRDGAAEFGTAFHAGAERIARTLELDDTNPAADWLVHYRQWFDENVVKAHWTERVLVNLEWGYAGTADLLIEHRQHGLVLVDIKTLKSREVRAPSSEPEAKDEGRRTKDKGPVLKPYRSWCYQLAAYRRALPPLPGGYGATSGMPVKCMNLMVNSREASAPVEHLWSEEEMDRGWRAFAAAHVLWVIEKEYHPAVRFEMAA